MQNMLLPLPQVSAGGSLSNTLIGLSRLGQADNQLRGSGGFEVALAGAVGSDTLGSFFAAQAAKAGVDILQESIADSSTGVLTCRVASTALFDAPGVLSRHAVPAIRSPCGIMNDTLLVTVLLA